MFDYLKSLWKSEGVLLAAVPLLCVFFSLVFEFGYASHFGYPKWANAADFTTIILLFLRVVPNIVFVVSAYSLMQSCLQSRFILARLLGIALYQGKYLLIIASAMSWASYSWLTALAFYAFVCVVPYSIAAYFAKKDGRYWSRVRLLVSRRTKGTRKEIEDIKSDKRGLIIRLCIVIPVICFYSGLGSAYFTTQFYSTHLKDPDGEYAVIRTYGSTLVMAEINRDKHSLTKRFRFIQLSDSAQLVFEMKNSIKHNSE